MRSGRRTPIPAGFGLCLAQTTRRPNGRLVVGGAPTRILRLSTRGSKLLDAWTSGEPVGDDVAAGLLARRLVDAGIADPLPPGPVSPGVDGVAFAIPVRNDAVGLIDTLSSLYRTIRPQRVVIVDDASEMPLQVTFDDPGSPLSGEVSLLRRRHPGGPGAARNTAWSHLAGGKVDAEEPARTRHQRQAEPPEIVVFLDAGVTPEPGWLEMLLAHFSDPKVGAVAPRVRSRGGQTRSGRLAAYERHRSPLDLGPHPGCVVPGGRVSYVPSAALAVRLRCLADAGGFDEDLRYGEDVDLVWRLSRSGWAVRYEPGAQVSHPARPSWRGWLAQRYNYGRSAGPLALRHPNAVAPLSVSAWSVSCWALASTGRLRLAAALTVGTPLAFAWRATRRTRVVRPSPLDRDQHLRHDPPGGSSSFDLAYELFRLALRGNVAAAVPICSAARRAWSVPLLGVAWLAWPSMRSRTRRFAAATCAAVVVCPGLADRCKHRSQSLGVLAWCALRLADDLAYQAGVWTGSFESGSLGALLPRFATAKRTSSPARPV